VAVTVPETRENYRKWTKTVVEEEGVDSKKRELVSKDPLVVVHAIYEPLGDRGKGRSAVLIMVMGGVKAQKETEEVS